ncbi:hypothetical protein [Moraxella phage Mcat28]|nr:hypothetical protein [Moraxella phage Mcat28]
MSESKWKLKIKSRNPKNPKRSHMVPLVKLSSSTNRLNRSLS